MCKFSCYFFSCSFILCKSFTTPSPLTRCGIATRIICMYYSTLTCIRSPMYVYLKQHIWLCNFFSYLKKQLATCLCLHIYVQHITYCFNNVFLLLLCSHKWVLVLFHRDQCNTTNTYPAILIPFVTIPPPTPLLSPSNISSSSRYPPIS